MSSRFPWPTEDHAESSLNLHTYAVQHPVATFFWRAKGDAMQGAGIWDGDILVVDRALDPVEGKVMVVWCDGQYLVRRWYREGDTIVLMTDPPSEAVIVTNEQECRFRGTVTQVLHRVR